MFRGDYASLYYTYDYMGNILSEGYYGLDDQPVISSKGFAVRECTYDEMGNILTEQYLDENGKLLV